MSSCPIPYIEELPVKNKGEAYKIHQTILEDLQKQPFTEYEKSEISRNTNPISRSYDNSLDNILVDYLSNFGVKVKDIFEFKNKRNISTLGVSDLLNKIIYVSENRKEDTLPEEAGHLITMLLGQNHPYIKELMSEVENWEEYQSIKDKYLPVYKSEERVKFEAVGKLLAQHLIKEFHSQKEESLFRGFINKILNKIREFISFDTSNQVARKISSAIIKNDLDLIDLNLPSNYERVNIDKAFSQNKEAQRVNNVVVKIGGILTGSLAISVQSPIYRDQKALVHDLDYQVNTISDRNLIINKLKELGAVEAHAGFNYDESTKEYGTRAFAIPFEGYVFEKENRTDKGGLVEDAIALRRLKDNKIIWYGKNLITVVDLFLENKNDKNYFSYKDVYNIFKAKQSFNSKSDIFFSREKDQTDYKHLDSNHISNEDDQFIYYQLDDVVTADNNESENIKDNLDTKYGQDTIEITKKDSEKDYLTIDATNTLQYKDFVLTNQITADGRYKNLERYLKDMNYNQKVVLKTLLDKLSKVAPFFKIEAFDTLIKGNDRSLTDFSQSLIKIAANADFADITEEIFHVLIEMVDPKTINTILENIQHTHAYREVMEQYSENEEYKDNPLKLKKEALGKVLSQMSANTKLEDLMSTKNPSVLVKIQKAIRDFFHHLYELFKNVNHDDVHNLFESVMYDKVKYISKTPEEYAGAGIYYASEKKLVGTSTLTFIYNLSLDLQNVNSLVIDERDLLDKTSPNNLYKELVDMHTAVYTTENENKKNLLRKVKIYVRDINKVDINIRNLLDLSEDNPYTAVDTLTSDDTFATRLGGNSSEEFKYKKFVGYSSDPLVKKIDISENYLQKDGNLQVIKPNNNISKIERITEQEVKVTDFEKGLKFLEELSIGTEKDSFAKLLHSLGRNLEKNVALFSKLGIANSTESFSDALNTTDINMLRNINNDTDLLRVLGSFYRNMENFKQFYSNLKDKIFDGTVKLTVDELNKINESLITWSNIIKFLKESNEKKGFTNQSIQNSINDLQSSIDNLYKVIYSKTFPAIVDEIHKQFAQFNHNLANQITIIKEKYNNGENLNPSLLQSFHDALKEAEESVKTNTVTKEKLLNDLLQTDKQDLHSGISKYNLSPIFDRWLVNVRYANDPILAYFGKMLNTVYGEADIEMFSVTQRMLDLSEKVKALGGEIAVGKILKKVVKRFDFKTVEVEVKIDDKLVKIKQQVPIEIASKEYVNPEGHRVNFLVPNYIPSDNTWIGEGEGENKVFSYGHLLAELNNIERAEEAGDKTLADRAKKLVKLKKDYDKKWFHQEFTTEYTKITERNLSKIALKNGVKIEDLEVLFKNYQDELHDLFNERTRLENLINPLVGENSIELSQELRAQRNALKPKIADMYIFENQDKSPEKRMLAELLSTIREEQDQYISKKVNLNIFVTDLHLLSQKLESEDLKNRLRSVLYNPEGKMNTEEVILTGLANMHRDIVLEDSQIKKSYSQNDVEYLKDFLENSIWYKPKEGWYEARKDIYDQLGHVQLLLNNRNFASAELEYAEREDGVLKGGTISMPDAKRAENQTEFDLINDLYEKGKVFNSMRDIREYIKSLPVGYTEKYVLINSRVNYVNLLTLVDISSGKAKTVLSKNGPGGKTEIETLIADYWQEIIDITAKYRDKFGVIAPLSKNDQAIVKIKEQTIYNIMKYNVPDNDFSIKLAEGNKKSLKERKLELAKQLEELQEDVNTDAFYDEMKILLEKMPSLRFKLFKDLRDSLAVDELFKSKYKDLLKQLIVFFDIDSKSPFISLQQMSLGAFKNAKKNGIVTLGLTQTELDLNQFEQTDLDFLKFIVVNHVRKSYKEKEGEILVTPTYNHRLIIPTSSAHLDINFDNKYISKDKIDSVKSTNASKHFNGDWKLLNQEAASTAIYGESDRELLLAYKKLTVPFKEIHSKWVEDIHIAKQKEIALNDTKKIAKGSYLGYKVAYMEKQYSEMGFFHALKSFFRELLGLKNPFETREVSVQDVDESDLDLNKKKKSWDEWRKNLTQSVTALLNRLITSNDVNTKNPIFYKSEKSIPVDYTFKVDGHEVSDNLFLTTVSYLNSLIKARHLSDNMYKVDSLREVLRKNNPFKEDNASVEGSQKYGRLAVLEATIGSEIYRNNIGKPNAFTRFLGALKKLMVLKSQNVSNVTGWSKNLSAGLMANYINSINVPQGSNFIWNRLNDDVASTMDGFKFALASAKGGITGETLIQFVARTLNPQHRDIKELLRNSDRYHINNLLFDGKIMMAGMKIGETVISYQLLLDVVKRIEFLREKTITNQDGTKSKTQEYVKFMDIFEKNEEGQWKIADNLYTSLTGKLEYDENGDLDMSKVEKVGLNVIPKVKALIDQGVAKTIGSNQYKGVIFNNSYVRSLFFFVNYLVTLMQDVVVTQRKDFVGNRVIDNYHLSFLKYIARTIQYAGSAKNYWKFMTTDQKQNILKALSTYISLYGLVFIMRYLFGFNPKEKDAFKKLKENSWFENFLIVSTLKTASEIEQLSITNPLSKTMFPVITANWQAITNPTLIGLIKQVGKTAELGVDEFKYDTGLDNDSRDSRYTKDDFYHDVHTGDSKFIHSLLKYVPIAGLNDRFLNMPGQIKDYQLLNNQ